MLYRREAEQPNAIWQADHCQLPILVQDGQGKCGRPWLTVIEDDKSRAIAGYRLSWSARSRDPDGIDVAAGESFGKKTCEGLVCGIPDVFYTDHGTDFTSVHLSQVGADLKMQQV